MSGEAATAAIQPIAVLLPRRAVAADAALSENRLHVAHEIDACCLTRDRVVNLGHDDSRDDQQDGGGSNRGDSVHQRLSMCEQSIEGPGAYA
jgi:hypothetical protein